MILTWSGQPQAPSFANAVREAGTHVATLVAAPSMGAVATVRTFVFVEDGGTYLARGWRAVEERVLPLGAQFTFGGPFSAFVFPSGGATYAPSAPPTATGGGNVPASSLPSVAEARKLTRLVGLPIVGYDAPEKQRLIEGERVLVTQSAVALVLAGATVPGAYTLDVQRRAS